MIGKYLIRSIGVLTCLAVVASGWEAEAGWRRHHRRCCEPVCCEPVCCEPVCCEPVCCEPVVYKPVCCEPVVYKPVCCEPVCETVCCRPVVYETVIVPMPSARACCSGQVVISTPAPASQTIAARGAKATTVSFQK